MRVSKKYRFCIHVSNANMVFTIFLFIGTSQFMFLDDIINIIINACATYDPELLATIHCLSIDIKAIGSILKKHSIGFHLLVSSLTFFVDLRRIMVEIIWKIHFRLNNAVERDRITVSFDAGFFLVQYIVRATDYTFY